MGDFSHQFHRPNAGSHTVEGNVSGSRAAMLERKRQAQQEEFEIEKRKRQKQAANDKLTIGSKFQTARIGTTIEGGGGGGGGTSSINGKGDTKEKSTIGLVSAKDFALIQQEQKKKQQQFYDTKSTIFSIENLQSTTASSSTGEKDKPKKKLSKKEKKKKKKEKKKTLSRLSFANDDDEDGDDEDTSNDISNSSSKNDKNKKTEQKESSTVVTNNNKKISKDPTIDTSFLPDKEREELEIAERIKLEIEWKQKQQLIQKETLEITYSYWDGSGHRRSIQITKGSSVGDFLELVRNQLSKEFREMNTIASDALLYVKEDLILPHDITFYDLIATKARGKSGPLFHFDVHDDIRVGPLDSRVEKDESHPGKVVERRWYDRNKHIFPASRWEIYDPMKDYGTYTIHGGEVTTKN